MLAEKEIDIGNGKFLLHVLLFLQGTTHPGKSD
jgi:hypothetical protein